MIQWTPRLVPRSCVGGPLKKLRIEGGEHRRAQAGGSLTGSGY